MNFYKRHIGDYLKDTAHLSLLEHGVYTRLLDVYYTREDGIPKQDAARLIGARSKEEKSALESVLNEYFECFDGVWRQGRCDREIAHATQKAERNREFGKLGGRPPKTSNGNGNGSEPKNNPNGFDSEPTGKAIQTPDSRSQTPVTREERVGGASPPEPDRPPNARSARATRIPDDFELTQERRQIAETEKLDPERVFANFTDYWRAKGGAGARKVCWDSTWRVWCRSEKNKPNALTHAKHKPGSYADWASKHAEHEDQGFG